MLFPADIVSPAENDATLSVGVVEGARVVVAEEAIVEVGVVVLDPALAVEA